MRIYKAVLFSIHADGEYPSYAAYPAIGHLFTPFVLNTLPYHTARADYAHTIYSGRRLFAA